MRSHMKAAAVVAVALGASATPVIASGSDPEMELVGMTEDRKLYVHIVQPPRSIGDGFRQVWTSWLHIEPQPLEGKPGESYHRVRRLLLVHCPSGDFSFRQSAYYKAGAGDKPASTWSISLEAAKAKMEAALPGSLAEAVVEATCAKK